MSVVTQAKTRAGQVIHRFPNGYGASVISDGYGSDSGLYEVGVLKFDGDKWALTYQTPITDDVLGWQSREDVHDLLSRIAALTERDIADEQIARRQQKIAELQEQIDEIAAEIARLEEQD